MSTGVDVTGKLRDIFYATFRLRLDWLVQGKKLKDVEIIKMFRFNSKGKFRL